MTFSVTILGNGSAMPSVGQHNSAHVLNVYEQFYLIDCGEGTQIQMRRYGINPLKINAVFITHLHGDHVFGLPGLISTMNFMRRRTPLLVFGVRPLDEIIASYLKYFGHGMGFEIIFKEMDSRKNDIVFENKVMTVRPIPLQHGVPTVGYLFSEKQPPLNVDKQMIEKYGLDLHQIVALKRGEDITTENGKIIANSAITYIPHTPRSYAFCSDTQYSPKIAEIVRGVDLLYHEATYIETDRALAKRTKHSTALQAAQIAASAEVESLLLGHFSSRYHDHSVFLREAKTVFENTFIATEGETIKIYPKKSLSSQTNQ